MTANEKKLLEEEELDREADECCGEHDNFYLRRTISSRMAQFGRDRNISASALHCSLKDYRGSRSRISYIGSVRRREVRFT